MSELKSEMAFEIGDIVYFKTSENTGERFPKKHIVVERYVQQCHGGVQRLYRLGRDCEADGLVSEIELTKERPELDHINLADYASASVLVRGVRYTTSKKENEENQ